VFRIIKNPTLSEDDVEQFDDVPSVHLSPKPKHSNSLRKLETFDAYRQVEDIDAEEDSVKKVKVQEEEKEEKVGVGVIYKEVQEETINRDQMQVHSSKSNESHSFSICSMVRGKISW
jgi:hypothetical protein